jgi:hypothetical protein
MHRWTIPDVGRTAVPRPRGRDRRPTRAPEQAPGILAARSPDAAWRPCELTDTYSPAAIDSAPATSPATYNRGTRRTGRRHAEHETRRRNDAVVGAEYGSAQPLRAVAEMDGGTRYRRAHAQQTVLRAHETQREPECRTVRRIGAGTACVSCPRPRGYRSGLPCSSGVVGLCGRSPSRSRA